MIGLILFGLGMIVGYFLTHLIARKIVEKGGTRQSITFNIKDWQVHVHHWLMGGIFFVLVLITGTFHVLPKIYTGLFGGLMLHDFRHDKEWYKVVKKKCYNKKITWKKLRC
jgi:hypothetical protein